MPKGHSILIIDDEPPVLQSIADYLEDRGYRIFTAQNGHEGLAHFTRYRPDLILTDLLMPEMDGFAVLRHIRKADPDKPLIVVSGTGQIRDAIEALRLGAWDYILKPIADLSVVLHAVDRALERAHLLAENRAYQENLEKLVEQRTAALERANAHLTGINTRLKEVVATTRGLSVCDEVAEFGATLLNQFAKHMLADGGSLFIMEAEGLRRLHTLDPDHVPPFIPFPLNEQSVLNRVIQDGCPLLVTDMAMEKKLLGSGWRGYTNGSALAFPLRDENDRINGVLTLHSKIPPPFIEQDKEIGTILASYSCETLRATRSMSALRESEIRFRELAEMLPEAVFETDRDLTLTFANRKAAEFFGYVREDLTGGLRAMDLLVPAERPQAYPVGEHSVGSAQHTGLRRDGSTFPMLFHMAPIKKENVTVGFRGVVVDITDELAMKDYLRQAQKMEAVGQLAGGIAHDLNNMLSPILGFSEMLLDDLDENDERRLFANEIVGAGMRARDLVRKLLAFSRKQTLAVKPVNINTILAEFERLMRRTIREDIEIEILAAPALPACMADAGQIEQVIINLAVNAADAMPHGGRLTFATRVDHLDDANPRKDLEMQAMQPGPYVVLTVSDTGQGMHVATCRKIFEPFFSTKGARGTGLGLSTVYGILKQHDGGIWVDSQPGVGTRFTIYLPACSHPMRPETDRVPTGADLRGAASILLVEDNAQVRRMIQTMLERQGYTVIVAQDGDEALSALQSHAGRFDLMLTDVVLPDMNGREIYDRAVATDPDLMVLYMSGYSDDTIAHHGVLEEGMDFIQKPFSTRALAEKIQQVLKSQAAVLNE